MHVCPAGGGRRPGMRAWPASIRMRAWMRAWPDSRKVAHRWAILGRQTMAGHVGWGHPAHTRVPLQSGPYSRPPPVRPILAQTLPACRVRPLPSRRCPSREWSRAPQRAIHGPERRHKCLLSASRTSRVSSRAHSLRGPPTACRDPRHTGGWRERPPQTRIYSRPRVETRGPRLARAATACRDGLVRCRSRGHGLQTHKGGASRRRARQHLRRATPRQVKRPLTLRPVAAPAEAAARARTPPAALAARMRHAALAARMSARRMRRAALAPAAEVSRVQPPLAPADGVSASRHASGRSAGHAVHTPPKTPPLRRARRPSRARRRAWRAMEAGGGGGAGERGGGGRRARP